MSFPRKWEYKIKKWIPAFAGRTIDDMINKAAVIIPARYGSTRFPGKALVSVQSKPLIQWIYEAAARSRLVNRVIVATDDMRIYKTVEGFGGEVTMTSSRPRTGSDRCAEIAEKLEEEIIINLQADELLNGSEMFDELILFMIKNQSVRMGTLKREIFYPEELWDRNVVKVVTDNDDNALYFSRSPIPYIRGRILSEKEGLPEKTFYKHLGIYSYRRDFLLLFSALPTTKLEDLEKLEQLRVIESGYRIKVKETGYVSYRVDTPEDLLKINELTAKHTE